MYQQKIPQGPPSDQSDDEADQFVKGGKNRHVINADGEIEAQEKKENRGDDDVIQIYLFLSTELYAYLICIGNALCD